MAPKVSVIEQPNPRTLRRYGAKSGDQFLQFQLFPDMTALLAVQQIAEILTVPASHVVPIPHMPAWVMGVYNWRGEILWLADLGHLIGLPPIYQQGVNRSQYSILVLHSDQKNRRGLHQISQVSGRKLLGLAVAEVNGIEWCDPDQIQSPPGYSVTAEIAPYLRGYLIQDNAELRVALDGNSILTKMPQLHGDLV